METAGLITRRRDPANRRIHIVAPTAAGDAMFLTLRDAAAGFDQRLRAGIPDAELAGLRDLLARLAANAGAELAGRPGPPAWPGLDR
jgi:MarR family transcriptional regulator for hemolysin